VLNALWQSEENHERSRRPLGGLPVVLNALRQSEENHLLELTHQVYKLRLCSTPYGNQRKITPRQPAQIMLCGESAQRLTAIRGKSLEYTWVGGRLSGCSTPYGNQRKITKLLKTLLQCNFVLNALRQSEENHTAINGRLHTAYSCSTPYGNQRKITRERIAPAGSACSAQRLTAIRGKSRDLLGCDIGHKRVLNALRQSEENHSRIRLTANHSRCAQRLTAIRGKSHGSRP